MTFKIPSGVLEQHVIALGKTGSGKSSKLRVLVEGLLDVEEPVCILDVKGDWWGLKSSADGKHAGYPLVIFGGKHGDVPLSAAGGKDIAELVFTGNRPCIIDMRALGQGERARFFIDLASTAYKVTKGKRWLVMSEVHNFCPKGKIFSPQAGEMLHWANKLASEGRGLGLNLLADSQRGQKVHNDFLTSMETLIACKVIHKSDRDAIKDWIDGCADIKVGKQVLDSLAQLKKPEGWIWCPEIDFGPELLQFPLFKTFDSFKPQKADAPAQLKGWAGVDLSEVTAKLAAVVEEAKANNPAELKKRIAGLEAQLRKYPNAEVLQKLRDEAAAAATAAPHWADDPAKFQRMKDSWAEEAWDTGHLAGWKACVELYKSAEVALFNTVADGFEKVLTEQVTRTRDWVQRQVNQAPVYPKVENPHDKYGYSLPRGDGVASKSAPPPKANGNVLITPKQSREIDQRFVDNLPSVTGVQQRILDALANLENMGSTRPPAELICFMAGYSNMKSKGFANAMSSLRTGGLIQGMALTDAGRAVASPERAPADAEELQEKLMTLLGGAARRVLEPLIKTYPDELAKTELMTHAGYENAKSKGFANMLSRLRTLGFIDYTPGGGVVAMPVLFLQ